MVSLKKVELAEIKETIDSIFSEQNQYYFEKSPEFTSEEIAIGAYDERDEITGGIVAKIEYQNMHVSLLAVKSTYRGQSIGSQLLEEVERIAREMAIIQLTLTTRSYQAVDFYKKAGFKVYATLEDMPMKGVTKYYFNKRLT
ncbi:GNAT family N-acetyltransferase [Marinilactibacillus kalidii]|uniref:GNAT family N-acetyltransferase n=1 Tax=Marinilactibacillus kalidii TaxID=2820274 RepID=UPI001ABDBEB5|nr:GNAT family N-acetyltransferase [Marinilactibacillus kalidii]